MAVIIAGLCGLSSIHARNFSVTDYGATRNNNSDDDSRAIQRAIDAAVDYINTENSSATVLFPRGTYHLKSASETNYLLNINRKTGNQRLTIDGRRSTLIAVGQDTRGIFVMRNAINVVIMKFAVDYNPLPYFAGTVVSTNNTNRTVDFRRDHGTAPTSNLFANAEDEWGRLLHSSVNGRPLTNSQAAYFFDWINSQGSSVYRFKLSSGSTNWSIQNSTSINKRRHGVLISNGALNARGYRKPASVHTDI